MTTIRYFAHYMAQNNLTEYQGEYITPPLTSIVNNKIPTSFVTVLEKNLQQILQEKKILADEEIARNKEDGVDPNTTDRWLKRHQYNYKTYQSYDSKEALLKLIHQLNDDDHTIFNHEEVEILSLNNTLLELEEYSLVHAIRLSDCFGKYYTGEASISWYSLKPFLNKRLIETIELRQFLQAVKELGCDYTERRLAKVYLQNRRSNSDIIFKNSAQIVPFFMDNLDFIAEGLTLLPRPPEKDENSYYGKYPNFLHIGYTLEILARFDGIPIQFMPQLLEFAVGSQKTHRLQTQQLLTRLPLIHEQVIDSLTDKKQDIRANSAEWLAQLAVTELHRPFREQIIEALYSQLKKEKKEIVLASLLSALEALDQDVAEFFSPQKLLKDAQKGLKAKRSKQFEWFSFDSTNVQLTWHDGSEVNPSIIEWWIVLAEKLKDPTPNDLLKRYIGLLSDVSQRALSDYVLETFIAQDIMPYSLQEAQNMSPQMASDLYLEYGEYGWYFLPTGIRNTWSAKYGDENVTEELIQEELVKQLMKLPKATAVKNKGMLALAYKATGSTAVIKLQDMIKHHHKRTAQITALITALGASDDLVIIQFLLVLSKRYRTKSIQQLATDIVTDFARRNHWTDDELADRTIPTAGLDHNGVLVLDYDSRTLTAYVDEKDKFVLLNENGKVIKSLPAPRKNDDKEIIKEAKSLFSNSKKELKQVLAMQTTRFYEALCSQRIWTVADWKEYLYAHPLMRRLLTRLLWLEIDQDDTIINTFCIDNLCTRQFLKRCRKGINIMSYY